ncbi:F-box/kelch-repeat protein At3g23880-like [Silene latifolia]|uniref:F-box/kelch-repeat protein At3g23880-like n=1 Tax=Silene latifolia TaxID=37657 RepID=UPI003D774C41
MEGQNKDDDEDPVQHTEQKELPYDIIREMILPRLPMRSIVRFKSVSKLWYSTLSYSRFSFAQLKFHQSSTTESLLIRNGNDKFKIMSYDQNGEIDLVNVKVDFDVGDEDMVLVGTCNGLVCLGSNSGRLFIVWNPITCQLGKYLETEISDTFGPKCLVYWGFGCVSTGDDYKIVRLCMDMSSHSLTVHVYSIKLDTWRVINNDHAFDFTSSQLSYPMFTRITGLFVNETLYWRLPGTICSVNLSTEKLDTIRHLEVIATPLSFVTSDNMLFVVNGCLSSYGTCLRDDDRNIFTILKSLEVTEQIIVPTDDNLVQLDLDFVAENFLRPTRCCNGLICLTAFSGKYFALWNPATRKLRKYASDGALNCSYQYVVISSGFGYVSAVDDYKYVRILRGGNGNGNICRIFSLRENKWRKIEFGDDPFLLFRCTVRVDDKLYI